MDGSNMDDKYSRWLSKIWATRDEEINCSECFDLVSAYVDLELSGGKPEETLPMVKHHIDQCAVCKEEYLLLRDLARQDK
jgi:hypothetical protein